MARILPATKNYEWGKAAEASLVYEIACASGRGGEAGARWAEAWIGSHAAGPATDLSGAPLTCHPGFLLKVLSIGKCLSIQIHPDESSAKLLCARDPARYPDDQAKPEVVVALTPMRLFCGFASPSEIRQRFCASHPKLAALFGARLPALCADLQQEEPDIARRMCAALGAAAPDVVAALLAALRQDLRGGDARSPGNAVLRQLLADFPGDPGILATLCLNLVELAPFESAVIPPCVPHAYISGDAVECMGSSDNVIRLGLSPKHRDLRAFVELARITSAAPAPRRAEKRETLKHFQIEEYVTPFDRLFTLGRCSSAHQPRGPESIELTRGSHFMGVNLGDTIRVNDVDIARLQCFYEPRRLLLRASSAGEFSLFFAYRKTPQ